MARLDTSRKVTTYFHFDDDFDIYTYIYTNNNDGGDEYDVTWQGNQPCQGWIIFIGPMFFPKNDYHDNDRNDKSP